MAEILLTASENLVFPLLYYILKCLFFFFSSCLKTVSLQTFKVTAKSDRAIINFCSVRYLRGKKMCLQNS